MFNNINISCIYLRIFSNVYAHGHCSIILLFKIDIFTSDNYYINDYFYDNLYTLVLLST
jgi:hypothetical protein